jgi:hypothetical protein
MFSLLDKSFSKKKHIKLLKSEKKENSKMSVSGNNYCLAKLRKVYATKAKIEFIEEYCKTIALNMRNSLDRFSLKTYKIVVCNFMNTFSELFGF